MGARFRHCCRSETTELFDRELWLLAPLSCELRGCRGTAVQGALAAPPAAWQRERLRQRTRALRLLCAVPCSARAPDADAAPAVRGRRGRRAVRPKLVP